MRCEDVRALLPEHAEPQPRGANEVDEHLASCAGCRSELETYRRLLAELAELRDVGEDASTAAVAHAIELIPQPRLGARVTGGLQARRALVATIASIGGAAVGATAITLAIRRRSAHRAATALAGEGSSPLVSQA